MTRAIRTILVASATLLLAAAPALATDDEIIALAEQSDRAFVEGRYAEADAAGEAAWRQAEIEWGAVEDTAFLADNLARQRLMLGQRAAAREPAARVLELAEAGLTPSIRPEEARLTVAIAAFDPLAPDANLLEELENALHAAEVASVPPGQLLWSGWLDVARGQFAFNDWEDAQSAGQNVMNIMDLAAGVPDAARVEAGIIAGNAAWQIDEFAASTNAYSWALAHVPQRIERDGESVLNPSWATLAAWNGLAHAAAGSLRQQDEVSRTSDIFGLDEMGEDVVCPGLRPVGERKLPEYPEDAARVGRIGAAIIEYEIGSDGMVQNAEISSSVPDRSFGEAALRAAETWRYDPASINGCIGQKLVTHVEFWIPAFMPRVTRAPRRD